MIQKHYGFYKGNVRLREPLVCASTKIEGTDMTFAQEPCDV